MSTRPSNQLTIRRATPWTAEYILGFATAGLLLEVFFIEADRKGLLVVGGFLYAETQNMPRGCTAIYRALRLLLSKAF
jgi:hypothetical protein